MSKSEFVHVNSKSESPTKLVVSAQKWAPTEKMVRFQLLERAT